MWCAIQPIKKKSTNAQTGGAEGPSAAYFQWTSIAEMKRARFLDLALSHTLLSPSLLSLPPLPLCLSLSSFKTEEAPSLFPLLQVHTFSTPNPTS